MRYKLTIAYDGTAFHGWQAQEPPGVAPLRTVQSVMQEALAITMQQPIKVQGASRTDAGVHAIGQVAHFDAQTRIPIERMALAINARLPWDVEVRRAEIVHPQFDAIRDAIDKQYRYRLWTSTHRPLTRRHVVYHCWTPLHVQAMQEAAARIIGEHDFAAFASAGHGRESTVRTVHDCRIEVPPPDELTGGSELHIVISGSGFLYNMVRIIAGTLVEIGRGHWSPERVDLMLREAKRELAGPTLPAQGLCLEWIKHREVPVAVEREQQEQQQQQ
jgi:tRNA pseudouridine38-40 synthase